MQKTSVTTEIEATRISTDTTAEHEDIGQNNATIPVVRKKYVKIQMIILGCIATTIFAVFLGLSLLGVLTEDGTAYGSGYLLYNYYNLNTKQRWLNISEDRKYIKKRARFYSIPPYQTGNPLGLIETFLPSRLFFFLYV